MPPRPKKPTGPTPVESITHADKRANIPTSDAQEFVTPEVAQARSLLVERDPSLDPQLVWRGKYGDESLAAIEDAATLTADAPPIYIQEKIDPRVLVENLRRTADAPADEPEATLFDSFDGLDDLDLVEFYKHDASWSNRMILGDSLQVMASLTEREDLRGKVQMIYIDPPYGIKFGSNWQASTRKRDVKDGKVEDAARAAEQIKAFRDTWELGIHSYLSYLRDRLLVARELLTETGSCFVQIGDDNVHLVRSLMDEVFGSDNFVSQIVFRKKLMPLGSITLERMHDYILWYGKNRGQIKYHQLYLPTRPDPKGRWTGVEEDGKLRRLTPSERADPGSVRPPLRLFGTVSQWAPSYSASGVFRFDFDGRSFLPAAGQAWITSLDKMKALGTMGRLFVEGGAPRFVSFHDDFPYRKLTNPWNDTAPASSAVYVVQTNASVVARCILMVTDPGDLVLDPTCGSGTTAFAAEQWGRRWITIDTSRVALALARQRVMGARYPMYLLADSDQGRAKARELGRDGHTTRPATNDIRHGFVYEQVQHITLKSIANNPDIVEGMSREEIDAAIKRHADFETLYDKPYEAKNAVRVAGPFTVESLSPHRSLAFAGGEAESATEVAATAQPDSATFEQSILENLVRAGVQNGRRNERIEFDAVEPYAGTYIQAVGTQRTDGSANGRRIGIALGPQYGTVSQAFAKNAVREAIQAGDIDLLCVLGFAFDASTHEVTDEDGVSVETSSQGFAEVQDERAFGRIKLLLVRMNVDLLMGEDLKKTGSGNLFTVFGEPDIALTEVEGDQLQAELRGVDVYDPTTGEVRSNDTGQIALWMIDTDYNGDSFFVRHCYFTGGNDPFKRLRTALKADIDADAWASLYSTTSRPFARPTSGRIAVKVINDYGDEVMKVFTI